ncbi:putative Formyl-CoA transferase; caiB/baiF CoA-transferase family [Cupriavidus taiwanensis]|uniref:Formyl-CoA transferase caiB/baiF CoA-transferase family n=1 Tax=Cupriavidus taiwanensis TaxID=164546 RepID=A0A375EAF0_9BURK|nr:CaiB/BaiF CoA-transferase family protein [Cupriavidus taiwanensis]SOZ19208.1 putative Formyl-CoA transferase; caiB/baiF CoA-transferase family [Cupriavidus taiwanensis]SOZ32394.1 putative Formyl-CoA transferase; caiB/baiF CoA-transferase family [Cupriavidus taiwanensis]SOZ47985.1 putative Formyl-CoA transferase; caiB/baiF CoA-transferase family [Cupriavidus taiwanensis]SOZ69016.1 putative Formyl-CoA transferase; caiB/baiF CoA-transferase family [Cupriavidus taiwanensis]SOZ70156.1 putative F
MADTNHSPRLPLAGVRVLDLSRVLAGPMCTQALGDLGAEVIKVEHPGRGDDTRDWGLRVGTRNTAYFNSANRNKQSIGIDLQQPEGQRIVRELAAKCDVLVQNFKFGGIDKMGLGYEALKAINPGLVYCSITGYRSNGPEATRPGYDLVVQGEAGLMALNGEEGQGPLKFGTAVVDMFTGMYSAQAVLAALYDRQRTGQGRHVEMALYDCGLMITAYYGLEALLMGEDPPKYGNAHPSIVPYGVFDAADGPLVITVGNNAQFQRFCTEVIERPDLAADERFATNTGRSANRQALLPELRAELARRPRELLLARLSAAGIPCGEVLGLLEALRSRRSAEAGLLAELPNPETGRVEVLAPPYRLDGERVPVRAAPPLLSQDTERVLGDLLGMDAGQVAALKAAGVV